MNASGGVSQYTSSVRAAVEGGLDELNNGAKGARTDEHWQQPEASRARKGKGESHEGNEVHEFVAALRCRGRLV